LKSLSSLVEHHLSSWSSPSSWEDLAEPNPELLFVALAHSS
jgi:hypothetical protein